MSNRRAPIIAGVASALVVVLAIFILILPKRGQISDTKAELQKAEGVHATLQVQLAVLNQQKAAAPANRATLRQIQNELPLTVDEPGAIRSLQTALDQSGVEADGITFGAPVLAPAGTFSTVPLTLQATGSYFALDQFLSKVEFFPRAAKVLSVAITPTTQTVGTVTTTTLSMQVSMELYTSDISAGPGSQPGPTQPQSSPSLGA